MREIDEVAVRRSSKVIVDSKESAKAGAGDLIIAKARITGELGDVVNGVIKGREDPDEITLFKSVGVAVQDIAAATVVLSNAQKSNLGTVERF